MQKSCIPRPTEYEKGKQNKNCLTQKQTENRNWQGINMQKICYKWNDIRVTMMNGRKANIEITMKSEVNIHIISVMSNLNRLLQNTIFLLRFLFYFFFFYILYSFIFWQTKNVAQHGFFYQERIFIYIIYINAHKLIETMHVHTDKWQQQKKQQQ